MQKGSRYSVGENDTRPWGNWKVIEVGETFTAKRIEVAPRQRLSLQYHNHRSEHWIVVAGSGEATIGGDIVPVHPGRHVYIPSVTNHRIHNTGDVPLVFIEVQYGETMDEDDIVRIEDDYDRAPAT